MNLQEVRKGGLDWIQIGTSGEWTL